MIPELWEPAGQVFCKARIIDYIEVRIEYKIIKKRYAAGFPCSIAFQCGRERFSVTLSHLFFAGQPQYCFENAPSDRE